MKIENFEAAMEKVRGLLRREAPFKRQDTFSCSKIAGSAFKKIRTAREEGFSFAQICAALEEAGLLPGSAETGGM